jgi:hypothetical protein
MLAVPCYLRHKPFPANPARAGRRQGEPPGPGSAGPLGPAWRVLVRDLPGPSPPALVPGPAVPGPLRFPARRRPRPLWSLCPALASRLRAAVPAAGRALAGCSPVRSGPTSRALNSGHALRRGPRSCPGPARGADASPGGAGSLPDPGRAAAAGVRDSVRRPVTGPAAARALNFRRARLVGTGVRTGAGRSRDRGVRLRRTGNTFPPPGGWMG